MTSELLDTDEAAKVMRLAAQTLRLYRHLGKGPRYFVMGGRKVFYRRDDVEAWINEQYATSNPGTKATA